jgi:purine-binding chemotaxis protein CheW
MEVRSVNKSAQLLVFSLDEQLYALHLDAVERVVRAVAVTPLPNAPEAVLGIINVQGRIVPVINMRNFFRLKERKICTSDQFIISSSSVGHTFALAADAVLGVVDCPAEGAVPVGEILPRPGHVEGVMILADGMTLIFDIDKILPFGEETALGAQLEELGCLGAEAGERAGTRE